MHFPQLIIMIKQFCFETEGAAKIASQGPVISSSLLQEIRSSLVSSQVPPLLAFHFEFGDALLWKTNWHRHVIKFCAKGQQTFKNHPEEKQQFFC